MAVLGALGDLVLSLSADTARFQSDLGRAHRMAEKFGREVGRAIAGVAGSLAALGGAAGLGALIKNQIDAADAAGKMGQKLGIATETLSEYMVAARLSDVSNQQLQGGLQTLAKNQADYVLGIGRAKTAFQALGITQQEIKDLNGDTAKIFELIVAKLSQYEDGANKSAIATKLLGSADLMPLVNGLEKTRKEAAALGLIIDKDTAAAAERVNDNMTRLGLVVQALGLSMAKVLLPSMEKVTERMVEGSQKGEPWLAFLKEELRLVVSIGKHMPLLAPMFRLLSAAIEPAKESVRGFQNQVREVDNQLQKKPAPFLRDLEAEAKAAEEAFKKMKETLLAAHEDAENAAKADQEISRRQAEDLREVIELRRKFNEGMLGEEEQLATRLDQMSGTHIPGLIPPIQAATRAAESFNFTFNSALEDAIINGGNLSDVVRALGDDIARMLIRGSVTEPLGLFARNFMRDPLALFDPAGTRFGSLVEGIDFSGMPAFAEGTPFVERTGPALLHRGEAVIPAEMNRAGFGGVSIVQNISVDSRADQASILLAMRRAKDEAVAEVAAIQNRRGEARIG